MISMKFRKGKEEAKKIEYCKKIGKTTRKKY